MSDSAPIHSDIVVTHQKQMMLSENQEQIVRSRLGNAKCMICCDALSYEWSYGKKGKRTLSALCYRCNIVYYIRTTKTLHMMPRDGAIKLSIKMRITPRGTPRNKVVEILGSKCTVCSIADIELLEIHHINNDGALDRKRFSNPEQMWRYYILHPDEAKRKLQLLCANHHKLRTRTYKHSSTISK